MSALRMEFTLPKPELGAWAAGNTGTPGVWRFDSGQPGRHVMISALVHGNELCGAWALTGLLEAGVRPARGKLTLAFCNLDAFARFDAADHDASRFVEEDMNRQWSVERLATGLTAERRRALVLSPFVSEADWLLDLHSMHEDAPPLSLSGTAPENEALAVAMGTPPTIVADAGHADGVRMRDFGRFGDPAAIAGGVRSLLVECGFHGDPASRTVAQDQCARFLVLSGAIDADECHARLPGWRQPDASRQWLLAVSGGAVASGRDVRFVEPYRGLELIEKAGTVIGHDAGRPIVTPHDDCVLVMPSVRQARAGVTVVRFARRRPARG
ncbi:succinylglutamate desuccinylase/aspartoacylase family protein [Xylophilus sp. GOD-11R]|uniref:succinylglutamate desuccinylase/aspartoacylase domain-containing protein n=1 Tax=Xylophilus sp. GOD-11R TaxID=3089814 RepID=UPI00298C2B0C|nr:succinylglutamate desuccinylase/aspartoacylase family protein [Xylophilus sp. GOD-11R]WPB55300.1 succinylglutamate desuccinylase/aspartoacylase family protein [Xylophilus sp. GOD-11R]